MRGKGSYMQITCVDKTITRSIIKSVFSSYNLALYFITYLNIEQSYIEKTHPVILDMKINVFIEGSINHPVEKVA